jgi:uncharacterized protein (DUF302 family)
MSPVPYSITVQLDMDPAAAEERVRDALQQQGFGILSTIDVSAALEEKLGHHMASYRILGACNPALAKQAIERDPDIGALLPCNVLIRANATGGTDVVAADPLAMMGLGTADLAEIGREARARIDAALGSLQAAADRTG